MRNNSDSTSLLDLQTLPALVLNAAHDSVVTANDLARQTFGIDSDEPPKFRALLNASTIDFAVFADAVAHYGNHTTRDVQFCRTDGESLELECRARALGGSEFLLNFIDLKEQARLTKQAETDNFHRSGLFGWQGAQDFFDQMERQNQLILDAAGEGIYGIDAQGKATFVNRAAQEMLGWNAEDLIGKDLHTVIHHHHLNGDHYPTHECPIYDTFRKEKVQRVQNDAFWRKDGKPILVEYVSTPIYDRNVLAGAVVIFRDVTQTRANERDLRKALDEVETLKAQLEQENDYLQQEIFSERAQHDIVGTSQAVRANLAQVSLVAETDSNVLITGEGGTGKSLIASAIHKSGKRAKRPLVVVNCAAISPSDFEATFFGYIKRAFVGALQDHAGKLSIARNGTLYLKDVQAIPLEFQAKLMDVLQSRSFKRLGEERDHRIDLRLISSTSSDLLKAVREHRFREDLYFALTVFPIHCSPLKDRPDDLPPLALHFLKQAAKRHALPEPRLSKQNILELESHDWSGNVRELKNFIERATLLAQGGKLHLNLGSNLPNEAGSNSEILTDGQIRDFERRNLISSLRQTGGRVSGEDGAAALLGLSPTTVYSRIKAAKLKKKDWS